MAEERQGSCPARQGSGEVADEGRSRQSARREWELTAGNADYPVSARWVSHSTGLLVTAASDLTRSARLRALADICGRGARVCRRSGSGRYGWPDLVRSG